MAAGHRAHERAGSRRDAAARAGLRGAAAPGSEAPPDRSEGARGRRLTARILVLLLLAGCKTKPAPPPPDPVDVVAEPEAAGLKVDGIASSARTRDLGGNLTRAEAQLTTTVLLRGADASDRARIEIHAEGDAAESTPIAAGRARRPLGVPPGRYRVTVWLREAPTAEGEGVVRNVELPPAGDVALTVDTVFDTGTLLVSTTNRGRAVDDRTRLAIGPHDLSPGRALRFPPGKYEVKATWQSDDGTAHERVETAEVRASQTTKLAIDFGVAAGSLRVLVTDPDGRDLTRDSRVVVETAGGKRVLDASAALDHPLPAGTYKVTVVWSAPPFARALATLPEVVVTASERATLIPVALKARVGTLTFETNHPPDTCKVTLSRAAGTSESAEGLGPFRLPAGTWDARVECGGKSRDVPGLVIAPGKPFVRKLVL